MRRGSPERIGIKTKSSKSISNISSRPSPTFYSDPLVTDHASMQHLWDVEGNKYLDFFGGIVTISVGHTNRA